MDEQGYTGPVTLYFRVEDVTFAYPREHKDALDGASLQVPADRSIAVVGANGSGKSTLLYLLGLLWDKTLKRGRIGYRNGMPVITLHMEAYLGAPESYDSVEITGSPALKMKIAGGVHCDIATASIVVNSLPKILEVSPGLHTMRDMPIPSFFGGVR